MAEVAQPSLPKEVDALGSLQSPSGALPAPRCAARTSHVGNVAKLCFRGARCLNRACPDLWGFGEGNLLLLPDLRFTRKASHRLCRGGLIPIASQPSVTTFAVPKKISGDA